MLLHRAHNIIKPRKAFQSPEEIKPRCLGLKTPSWLAASAVPAVTQAVVLLAYLILFSCSVSGSVTAFL